MPKPIAERIAEAFRGGEAQLPYYEVARRVFPENDFPRAWRYSSNGGPPGCFMALTRALNRIGFEIQYRRDGSRMVRRPSPYRR